MDLGSYKNARPVSNGEKEKEKVVLATILYIPRKKLKAKGFLSMLVQGNIATWVIPAVLFTLGCVMVFATGTFWGILSLMIPINVASFRRFSSYYTRFSWCIISFKTETS